MTFIISTRSPTTPYNFSGENESDISEEMIGKLEEVGIKTYFGSHAFSGAARGVTNKYGGYSPLDVVADTLRMFAHGIKVSCEISIMAADAGLVPVGEEIIAIGGRGHGVDSAAIITPVNAKNLISHELFLSQLLVFIVVFYNVGCLNNQLCSRTCFLIL